MQMNKTQVNEKKIKNKIPPSNLVTKKKSGKKEIIFVNYDFK